MSDGMAEFLGREKVGRNPVRVGGLSAGWQEVRNAENLWQYKGPSGVVVIPTIVTDPGKKHWFQVAVGRRSKSLTIRDIHIARSTFFQSDAQVLWLVPPPGEKGVDYRSCIMWTAISEEEFAGGARNVEGSGGSGQPAPRAEEESRISIT